MSNSLKILMATLMVGTLSIGISEAEDVPAHDVISQPMPNDVVDGAMVDIQLGFKMPVDHRASTLTLRHGRDTWQLKPRLEAGTNYLISIVHDLTPGAYELDWVARLSNGRTETGMIPFLVKSNRTTDPNP